VATTSKRVTMKFLTSMVVAVLRTKAALLLRVERNPALAPAPAVNAAAVNAARGVAEAPQAR